MNLDVKFLVNPTVQNDASFRRGAGALPCEYIYSEMYRRMKYSSALFRFFVKKSLEVQGIIVTRNTPLSSIVF